VRQFEQELQVGCPVDSLLKEEVGWKLSLGNGLQQWAVLLEGIEGGDVCVFLLGGEGSMGRGRGVQCDRFLSLLKEQSVAALTRVVCMPLL